MSTADLVAELRPPGGRGEIIFRERMPGGRIVYCVTSYRGGPYVGPDHVTHDLVAHAYLADQGGWYWVRADGSVSYPCDDVLWLGWLLDLARENGWEP